MHWSLNPHVAPALMAASCLIFSTEVQGTSYSRPSENPVQPQVEQEFPQQPTSATGPAFCDTVCRQVTNGNTITSVGGGIVEAIWGSGGRFEIIQGGHITTSTGSSCGYDASTIWKLWAQAHEHAFPNKLSQLSIGADSSRICIDTLTFARLTAAATQCYNNLNGAGGSSSSSSGSEGSYYWTTHYQTGTHGTAPMQPSHQGGGVPPQTQDGHGTATGGAHHQGSNTDNVIGSNDQAGGSAGGTSGGSSSTGSVSSGGGFTPGGNTQQVIGGTSEGNYGGSSSGSSSIGGSTTSTSSGWGHGNVHSDSICFKIKSKDTDKYLTTYGAEYAFARLAGYYSVFKARPSKNVAGGFSLTEINRNGGAVEYPVKVMTGTGVFKPLHGDKDAVWTFNPATFGDSCWGVAGKKMAERQDWGGWGKNYREASSGEDCIDVELEQVDC